MAFQEKASKTTSASVVLKCAERSDRVRRRDYLIQGSEWPHGAHFGLRWLGVCRSDKSDRYAHGQGTNGSTPRHGEDVEDGFDLSEEGWHVPQRPHARDYLC